MARGWYVTAGDGKKVFYYRWNPPEGDPKAAVQIVHGMAEHAARYDDAALRLTKAGYIVYAQDLRGHGKTAEDQEELGFIAQENGWERMVEDIREIGEKIRAEQPDIPLFLIGHSMGSFLSRTMMFRHPGLYRGVVLSGTGGNPGVMGRLGRRLALRNAAKHGLKHRDRQLDSLSFGSFNRQFKPSRTSFDWLSRDDEEVDLYVDDPLCGFICTSAFFRDLLDGLILIHDPANITKIPRDLPVLLISGTRDPVGKNGKAVEALWSRYREQGAADVTLKLWEGARHELFHETNRNEVSAFLASWLDDRLG